MPTPVEPGVYGRAKPIPNCAARTRGGFNCRRYGRYPTNSKLLCRVHAGVVEPATLRYLPPPSERFLGRNSRAIFMWFLPSPTAAGACE